MVTNESQTDFARRVVEHAAAVTAVLDKHSPDVRAFMRANFNLQLYPVSFVLDFAAKLEAFRPPHPGEPTAEDETVVAPI